MQSSGTSEQEMQSENRINKIKRFCSIKFNQTSSLKHCKPYKFVIENSLKTRMFGQTCNSGNLIHPNKLLKRNFFLNAIQEINAIQTQNKSKQSWQKYVNMQSEQYFLKVWRNIAKKGLNNHNSQTITVVFIFSKVFF